jgi:hypothetical protein
MTKGAEPIALGSCLVAREKDGCDAELAIPASTSGLAWLHAMSMPKSGGKVKSGKRLVVAGRGHRDLDLSITPDKSSWGPRDVGVVDVAVTNAGAPVMAELGVAVADEAVFALADVRPDLEKKFFTIDNDVARAQRPYSYGYYRYGSSSGFHAVPASLTAAAAYDASTAEDVRGTVLAALTTMPEAGGFDATTTSSVEARASAALRRAKQRAAAWWIVGLAALTVAAFAAFGLYGVTRMRRPLLLATPSTSADDVTTLRLETRALFVDFLTGVLAPPVLAVACVTLFGELLSQRSNPERAIQACWFALALLCSVLSIRAALRVRRVAAAKHATTWRRVLFFLPLAIFFAHVTILLLIGDEGRSFEELFGQRLDSLFLPLAIVAAAQITCGFLSVVRQTQLRAVTTKGRVWLLASRATFLGLPITLFLAVLLVVQHKKETGRIDWSDFALGGRDTPTYETSSDNKEGGTGTRAKGEEGSMGNPNTAATAALAAPSPGGANALAATVAPVARVRDYFPETLLWAPDVITDDHGHATVRVPFADSITTWRFALSAVSRAGQLGSASVPLVVKQDFFVDATLPPVLTQGDEIAVPVTVFSYTNGTQDVALELEGDGVSAVGDAKLALHLAKGEARGVRFRIKADKAGERVVRLKATSPTRADAMERKIVITPNGQAMTRVRSGRVTGNALAIAELPQNAIDGGNDLFIKIYGGPLSQVSEGLDGVFRMPHGCFEQTSSVTYPSILALQFLERTKSASPELEKKAREYIAQGYQRLVSFEVGGGGFSLFGSSPATNVLSAYGLLELSEMASIATVDESLVERTRDFLYKQRTPTGGWKRPSYDPKEEAKAKDDPLVTAYVAWALATSTKGAHNRLGEVLDLVAKGDPDDDAYALSLRALALIAGARLSDARPLLERLAKLAIREDAGTHFTSKAVGVMYSYGPSMDVEVTGLATHALALAAMEPEIRASALDWLASQRGAYGTWSTTQATIAAMRALLDEARPVTKAPQDIHVLVDGQDAESFVMEPKARDVHRLVSLRRFAKSGKHVVEIRASGDGDVSYQLVATHYVPWQRGPGAGLSLEVAYGPNAVDTGSAMTCRVKLGWRGKEAARMPLVEIGVPPAFEVSSERLDGLVREHAIERYTVERGKVTLYFVALSESKPASFDVPMRALWPAHVVVPSSVAYLYYEPEVRAETAPLRVQAL